MTAFEAWDRRTEELLDATYTSAGAGPRGSGSTDSSEGMWRAKRYQLAIPMDADGTWLDVGCANGHLLATLPAWASERDVVVEPYGLELLPRVAELARSLMPELQDRIWTGSVMTWEPPMRFHYVTALDDLVPPDRLGELVEHLIGNVVDDGGRLILSSYTDPNRPTRDLFSELAHLGHRPDGVIQIDRPGRATLRTAWFNA